MSQMDTLSQIRPGRKRNGLTAGPFTIFLFLAPALFFYVTLVVYPLVYNLYLSFFQTKAAGGRVFDVWVGFDNFRRILTDDPTFKAGATHSLIWAVAGVGVEIPLGVFLAIVLSRHKPLRRFFRTAWFVPVLLSYVMIGQLWSWVYRGDIGLLNLVLKTIGLGFLSHAWLGDTSTALGALIAVTAWHWVGFTMILCLAAISAIPLELDDAAKMDGAGAWKQSTSITLPLIRNTIATAAILVFIGRMKVFDLVWVATAGGPLNATETVGTYIVRRAFFFGTIDQGYAAAMSTIWFVVIIVVSFLLNRILWNPERYEY
jgi:ABC-type sugar transport system permease subunit